MQGGREGVFIPLSLLYLSDRINESMTGREEIEDEDKRDKGVGKRPSGISTFIGTYKKRREKKT